MKSLAVNKRIIALCVVASWALLVGVSVAEAFGRLHDTPEYADQTVEQALATPTIHSQSLSQTSEPAHVTFELLSTVLVEPGWTVQASLAHPMALLPRDPPPVCRSKLFQFLSIYRL